LFYFLESTFLNHRKAYGASPTDSEKSDFFHILAEKICFWIFLGFTKLNIDKAIWRQAIQKKIEHFRWKLRVFLTSDGKGGKNVKKLAQNRNNFQTHFQYDFSKYRIFPMEYIYPKIREKYEIYKKLLTSAHEKCSGFRPSKTEKWHFYSTLTKFI
jgi:hypothetical protein